MFLRNLKEYFSCGFILAIGVSAFLVTFVVISTISYWLGISVLKLIGVIA
jgi:hypothetical protein